MKYFLSLTPMPDNPPLPLFVQLMGKNIRNNFLEPRASTGETGRRELLVREKQTKGRTCNGTMEGIYSTVSGGD